MTRYYIAGPMTGVPEFNYPLFYATAERLRSQGHEVENPAESDGGTSHKPREFYLRKAIAMLVKCDAVVVLPNWENSRGACLEVLIAGELGMPILDVATMRPVDEMNFERILCG